MFPAERSRPVSSIIAISAPAATPTDPGLRFRGGKGLLAIWSDASVMPQASMTGWSKIRSISAISLGDSAEEQDRMKSNRDGFGMPPATATLLRMALVYGWDRS